MPAQAFLATPADILNMMAAIQWKQQPLKKPSNAVGSVCGYEWTSCTQICDLHILGPLFQEKKNLQTMLSG